MKTLQMLAVLVVVLPLGTFIYFGLLDPGATFSDVMDRCYYVTAGACFGALFVRFVTKK